MTSRKQLILKIKDRYTYDRRPYVKVEYGGRDYSVALFPFQESRQDLTEIRCNIDESEYGVKVTQDYVPLLKQCYRVGSEYDFLVTADFTSRGGYYQVADANGFYFRLWDYKRAKLYIHQQIKCRVKSLSGVKLTLELVTNSGPETTSLDPQEIKKALELYSSGTDVQSFVNLLFTDKEPFADACNEWMMASIGSQNGPAVTDNGTFLQQMRALSIYMLEENEILSNCNISERRMFQQRLTSMVEQIERYQKVVELIDGGQEEAYIDHLLRNLKRTGYIYHAAESLNIMIGIFVLRPDIVSMKMEEIFSIIHSREEQYWNAEPFRRAFVKTLELYVREFRKQADLLGSAGRSTASSMMEALAIQLYLAKEEDDGSIIDCKLNKAMLYRYASLQPTGNSSQLLYKAFITLMGRIPLLHEYSWDDTTQPGLLASRLTLESRTPRFGMTKVYEGAYAQVVITDDGVRICPLHESIRQKKLIGLPFLGLSVTADGGRLTGKKDDIAYYRDLWTDIERSLSSQPRLRSTVRRKTVPNVGDVVDIRVVSRDQRDPCLFRCKIEDEAYSGQGWLHMSDVLGYAKHLEVEVNAFYWDRDRSVPLLFKAQVKSVGEDGECVFSMQQLIQSILVDTVGYDEIFVCRIFTSDRENYIGVSDFGAPIYIPRRVGMPVLPSGTFVTVTHRERGRSGSLKVQFVGITAKSFYIPAAFHQMMNIYANDRTFQGASDEDDSEKDVISGETVLTSAYLQELMHLIDRYSASRQDYLEAYNYLGFARLLSSILEEPEMRDYYACRMKLIWLLKSFETNGKIDGEVLHDLNLTEEARLSSQTELYSHYLEIKAVSMIGHRELNPSLWNLMNEHAGTKIARLAELVLSYNLLQAGDLAYLGHDIEVKIYELLQLSQRESTLKNYGQEDLRHEFKSSLVYPSGSHMQPDLKQQTAEIMKEICSFLNADGGTLYIGVNDQGAGVGIAQDLAYEEFRGSTDRYANYLGWEIRNQIGKDAEAYVKISFDSDEGPGTVERKVCVIKVNPYPYPAYCDGQLYERRGVAKVMLSGTDLDLFMARRTVRKPDPQPVSEPVAPSEPVKAASIRKPDEKNPAKSIATSKMRPNVLHSYEENYVPTIAYLHFLPEHEYKKTTDEYWDETLLSLAIRDEERDHYLVICYEGGNVVKVPIAELLEKTDNKAYKRNADHEALFATIMGPDDGLVTFNVDARGRKVVRVDAISQLEEESIRSKGHPLCDVESQGYLGNETVPARVLPELDGITLRPRTTLGTPISASYPWATALRQAGVVFP